MCICLVTCDSVSESISIECCDMSIGLVNCGSKLVITAMSISVVALWTWDQLKRTYTLSVMQHSNGKQHRLNCYEVRTHQQEDRQQLR